MSADLGGLMCNREACHTYVQSSLGQDTWLNSKSLYPGNSGLDMKTFLFYVDLQDENPIGSLKSFLFSL